VEKLNNQKEAIMSVLRMKGPSLPIHVAREIKVAPLFVSAFLSELKAENKIRLSEMRVGSSPIYYIVGQEEKLENYVQYLNSREREAFHLLKEKSILMDDEQTPVVRVALRAIRDFAKGVRVRVNGESKLVWRHFMIGEDNVEEFISGGARKVTARILVAERDAGKIIKKVDPVSEKGAGRRNLRPALTQERTSAHSNAAVRRPTAIAAAGGDPPALHIGGGESLGGKMVEKVEEKKVEVKPFEGIVAKNVPEFSGVVRKYLEANGIELVEVFSEKKREFEARVSVGGKFGGQDYYLIAKDKKNISDSDLAVAVQKAQAARLLALIVSPGDLSKRGREHMGKWGNLVKFARIS